MVPRLNKRQQRELEELEALGKVPTAEEVPSEEEVSVSAPSAPSSFAALFTAEEEEEAQESHGETESRPTKAKKSKKKKKKAPVQNAETEPGKSSPNPNATIQKSNKNAPSSSKKGKEKKSGGDDFDRALAELSMKYPDLRHVQSTSTPSTISQNQTFASLLSVSVSHLDSEAELRKFFGSKAISAAKSDSLKPSYSNANRRQVGAQMSHLTRPQPSWWAAKQRQGLTTRAYDVEEVEDKCERMGWLSSVAGERWWTVEYSKQYKGATMSFMQTVMSGDPENFWRILKKMPWHADTLLQLSEVYRHREEYTPAVDFVDRALFAYERSFVGAFNFTSGLNRLDFDRVENRPFFMAIHRQVADLQRRGCVRTSFEFARLLYSLDPWTDPHGALLHLDYVGVRAGMTNWILDLWEFFEEWKGNDDNAKVLKGRVNPCFLPGWCYARALALRIKEDATKDDRHAESDAALMEAIQAFPEIVPLLADKADINLQHEIRANPVCNILTEGSSLSPPLGYLHLLCHLYAQRSASVWKDPKRAKWFATVANNIFPKANWNQPRRNSFLEYYKPINHRLATYRHIMILETSYRRLFSFIPRGVLDAKQLACDPLPPQTSINLYDDEFFKGTEDVFAMRPRSGRTAQRMLERLIPDPVFREQLQAVFDAQPALAQRFPGGIVQFAQAAGQMPEEVLDDIIIANIGNEHEQNRVMPGEMPGQQEGMFANTSDGEDDNIDDGGPVRVIVPAPEQGHENEESGGEDEDSDDEDIVPMPLRVIRNIMSRFWGTPPEEPDSSEDDHEAVGRLPVDNDDVD